MDDLNCNCSCYDGESAECYSERLVRARKLHKCCECGDEIAPGETYQRITGMREGDWFTFTTCVPCTRVRASLCSCGVFGDLYRDIYEANKSMEQQHNVELAWMLGLEDT